MDFGYFANISNPGLVKSYGKILKVKILTLKKFYLTNL